MKKLLTSFCILSSIIVSAQDNGGVFSGCASDQLLNNNSMAVSLQNSLDNAAYEYLLNHPANHSMKTMVRYIPVVVHIIHNGGPENISNSQVLTAISHFNANFMASDSMQIQFCMAQRDPAGGPTDGITRDVSTLTNETMEIDDLNMKNINRWPTTCYLNIWVVNGINSISMGPGVIGYATLPSSHGTPTDGVVIEAGFFGASITTDAVGTHELGHYLGLYHTFQSGCTNNNCLTDGDQVCDTPPDQTTFATCSPASNSCSTDSDDPSISNPFSSDVADLGNDYMDYSTFSCYNMFTAGQYTRMDHFLSNVRGSLLNCLSCTAPCPAPVTATIILPASMLTINTGTTVNFQGTYSNGTGQEWFLSPGSNLSTAGSFSHTFMSQGDFWMKYRAISGDPSFCLDGLDSVEILVIEPVATSCEGSLNLRNKNGSVHLPLTNELYSSNGFTWECWVKLDDPFGTSFRPMISAIDPVVYEDITLAFGWTGGVGNVPVTSLAFKVDGASGPSPVTCSYAPSGGFVLGNWYHVAGTMDYVAQTAKLYLDGALVDTKTITSTPITRIIPSQLGWDEALNPGSSGPLLGGHLDEVRIWKKARTDAEILADYNHCLTGSESDLVVYYNANQNAGTLCLDGTANAYHGSLTAPAGWSAEQATIITTNCASLCNSVCPPLVASSDTALCAGGAVHLSASGSYGEYSWSPAAGLSDASIPDPVAFPIAVTTYTLTGVTLDSNLVANPDFVLGNYGFTSGQIFTTSYAPCNYYVGATFFTAFSGLPDHTPTSDNFFMSVDGCYSAPTMLWEENIAAVTANTDYEFAFWATRSDAVQPIFEIHAIGNVTGDIVVATQPGLVYAGAWTWDQYGIPVWNSGPNTSVTFRIINLETNGYGNDFGMDDFSLRRVCRATDTVTVFPGSGSFIFSLGNDTSICNGGIIVIDAGPGFTDYTWQDGGHEQTHTAYGPGVYWVTVTDPCGIPHSDTLVITNSVGPAITLMNDTSVCAGEIVTMTFTSSQPVTNYHWEPGSSLSCTECPNPVSSPAGTTQYYLVATNAQGCGAIDSMTVSIQPDAGGYIAVASMPDNCSEGSGNIVVQVIDNSLAPYVYNLQNAGFQNNGDFESLLAGNYLLEVMGNNGCVYDTSITITNAVTDSLLIPNVFTPNGDQQNDVWFITTGCGEQIFVAIFNRWGKRVGSASETTGWDGKVDGAAPAADGVYYFTAEIQTISGNTRNISGFINLVR